MLILLYMVKVKKHLNMNKGDKKREKEIFIGWFMFNHGNEHGIGGVRKSRQGERFIFAKRRLRNGRGVQRKIVGKLYARKRSQNFFGG